jgi:hypothetical protein
MSGTSGSTQRQAQRRAVIDEFFAAYRMARQLNPEVVLPPQCVIILGLSWPCTRQEIKQAFRTKVKTAHPDNGGSSEAFQSLYKAYQEALTLVD